MRSEDRVKLLPKFRSGKNGAKNRQPTFVSRYPVVNELLATDPVDALLHEMEIEMWTDEQFCSEFDTGMSPEETVNLVWNNAWDHMGLEMRRALQAKIDILPPEVRRQMMNNIE